MSKEYEYGNSKKAITFEDKDGNYVNFIIKLRHEGLSRNELLRAFVMGFVEDNPLIEQFVIEYKKQKDLYRKSRQKILKQEKEKGKESLRKFGLDPDEIEDLFDMIEEESDLI